MSTFTEAAFTALLDKYQLLGYTRMGAGRVSVEREGNTFTAELGGLPNLSFFVELAKLADVPLESIETESNDNSPGCDTCGYGGGATFTVRLKVKP